MKGLALVFAVLGLCACSPIKDRGWFQEAEYDINLEKTPGQRRFFIHKDELPIYEQQFAKIKELGEEINCKITGNCNDVKRGFISKKSLFGDEPGDETAPFQDDQMGSLSPGGEGAAGIEGEDVSASMMGGKTNSFMQKNAEAFGQQPQMDVKLSQNELAAVSDGMGNFSPMDAPGHDGPAGGSPMGGGDPAAGGSPMAAMGGGPMAAMGGSPMGGDPMGGGSPLTGGGGPPSMLGSNGNDALMKLRDQQNSQAIDGAVQDKLNFMDKANGSPPMPQMPGVSDPLTQFPHTGGEGKGMSRASYGIQCV